MSVRRGWAEPASAEVCEGLVQLFLRVHDEGAMHGDQFAERFTAQQQRRYIALGVQVDGSFPVEQHELAFSGGPDDLSAEQQIKDR